MTAGGPLRLFVHVEEPSMAETAGVLLPKLLAGREVDWKVIDHGSKQSLLQKLPTRLRGYAEWGEPSLRILVLVDRDDDDCRVLKARLEDAAREAKLGTRSVPDPCGRFKVVNRIVIEELEAWFLGDVDALGTAFPGVPSSLGARARYRDPDAIAGGTWEALLQVLQNAGHYMDQSRLPKIEVARRITLLLVPGRNRSRSFQMFVSGLEALLAS